MENQKKVGKVCERDINQRGAVLIVKRDGRIIKYDLGRMDRVNRGKREQQERRGQ